MSLAMLKLYKCNTSFSIQSLISFQYGKSLLTYSTTSFTHPLTIYLIKTLGFSKEEALATSTKVSARNPRKNPNFAVNFFKQTGFDDTHIKKIVSLKPRLLSADVDKNLKPKIRVLQQKLGISGSELADFVAHCPYILCRNVDSQIVPAIDFITSYVNTKKDMLKVLRGCCAWGFSFDVANKNVNLLESYGVSKARLQQFLVRYPQVLRLNSQKLEDLCVKAVDKFGISVSSTVFLKAILTLGTLKGEILESKYEVFRSYGWSESHINTLIRKRPECMSLSNSMIERKLEFYMKKLGYEADYIASHPCMISYSLEKRITPRLAVLEVLKEKNLISARFTLYRVLTISDARFLNEYVLLFQEKLPGLYDAYVNQRMDSYSVSC